MKKFTAILIAVVIALSTISVYADSPQISAPSAILIDAETGRVLYEKNADVRRYPASTTKVMTGLLAAEYGKPDEKVTASQNVVKIERGSSQIYVVPGEVLTMEQLMYALMLESANDAAVAIAENISGSVEEFAKLMNERAKSIGAVNTNFVNPNGLHNDNHYTTARDLALIASEGMKNPVFKKIVGTYHYEIPATNKQDARPYITNSNKLISKYNNEYKYENAIGIKTGYTTIAQHCLVGGAAKDNVELISVVLADAKDYMYPDTIKLFEYGFTNFKKIELLKQNKIVTTIEFENGDRKLNLLSSADFSLVVSSDEINEIEKSKSIKINEEIKAPVKKGDIIGTVSYTVDGKEQKSINLIAEEDVKSTRIIDIIMEFLKKITLWHILIVVVLLFLIWRTIITIRKAKRRKRAMYLTKRRYF